jgi:hypothetical protein
MASTAAAAAAAAAAVVAQEEGIVAKQLDSPWKADDKSGAWLKLKPDYFDMQEVKGMACIDIIVLFEFLNQVLIHHRCYQVEDTTIKNVVERSQTTPLPPRPAAQEARGGPSTIFTGRSCQ